MLISHLSVNYIVITMDGKGLAPDINAQESS